MAAVHFAGGFSYAQAAKGHAAAAASNASSKTASTTPSSNEISSEPLQKSNWADDVEAIGAVKSEEEQKPLTESQPSPKTNGTPVDRTKAEEKMSNGASSISSPDLTASSITTKEDDSQSPPNGLSSESTWESRSQVSEPSWITERKERQNGSQTRDRSVKGESKGKSTSTPPQQKPAEYQESRPPVVNPWLKRAEDAKAAKGNPVPRPVASVPTPTPAVTSSSSPLKENQPPQQESRRKANSIASVPVESASAEVSPPGPEGVQERPNGSARSNSHQTKVATPKTAVTANGSVALASSSPRNGPHSRQSLPNVGSAPAPIADQSSWPTPDSVPEKDRKDSVDKADEEKRDEDTTPTAKPKKKEWISLPVNHSVVFETALPEPKGKSRGTANGERGGKSGSGGRGRGGYRGNAHTNGGDRQTTTQSSASPPKRGSDPAVDPTGRVNGVDRQAPAKALRASSTTSYGERETESTPGRNHVVSNSAEAKTTEKIVAEIVKNNLGSIEGQTKETLEPRRFKPSNQHVNGQPDAEADDFVPAPIPRRCSSETQAQRNSETADSSARQSATLPRSIPSDNRKESRPFDAPRDPTWSAPRSNKRGGRGRGGNGTREPANGHLGNHGFQTNYAPEFGAGYGTQPSPFQVPRGHHQYGYAAVGRGGWSNRGGFRSQSIPNDNAYFQRMGYMPNGAPPLSPINTYMAGMYEPTNIPMTAVPYAPQMDAGWLIEMVITQLEYYFSVENLIRDLFLRRHMDSRGFVFMEIVMNFNRVKNLTQDREVIRLACIQSEVIEIRVGDDGKERLRRAEGWQQFVLPMDQREESAQNEGSEQLRQPDRPNLFINSGLAAFRGPASAGLPAPRFDRRPYDSGYPMMNGSPPQYAAYNGIPEVMYAESTQGEEVRGRAARTPTHEVPTSPMGPNMDVVAKDIDTEPDAFLDEQVNVLTVVVKMSQQQQQHPPYHSLSSRTFSNGSIDSRSIMSEASRPVEGSSPAKKEGQPIVNGSEMHLPPVPRRASPNKARSNDRLQSESDVDVFWVKDQEFPVANLPPGLTSEPYMHLRQKALDQRNHAATGNCPYDMDVLYQFWCHFLIRNFNNRMYAEFKTHAYEDVARTNYTGVQNLVKFYAQSLSSPNPIRDRVAKDYVELVKNEPAALQGSAFKQLRSAWRNGALNLKNRKKLADIVDEKLKEQLDRLEA